MHTSTITRLVATWLAATMLGGAARADDLPRRGVLGVKLSPAEGGVKVEEILNPNLDAVKAGDLIVLVDGTPVTHPGQVVAALSRRKADEVIPLQLKRGAEALAVDAKLMPAALPALDGKPFELGAVTLPSGIRVRTEFLKPGSDALTRDGKAPVLMMVQGIPCITNDTFSTSISPIGNLYRLLNEKGFAIFLVEKPGVGDSEGEDCRTGGFDIEVEAFRAAALHLKSMPGIDPARLFAAGISMGAIQVPLIASEVGFKGIVTWGGAVMPWYDYMIATFRRRMVLQNQPAAEVEPMLRVWRKIFAAAFVDKLNRDEIAARMPDDLKAFEESAGSLEEIGGRSLKFGRECDAANIAAGWQAYEGELLALHGEFDWVSESYDDALSAYIVNANNPGRATFETLPGLDHTMTAHKTLADSFPNLMKGAKSDLFETRAAAWLLERAKL